MERGNWRGLGFAIGLEFEGEFEEVKGNERGVSVRVSLRPLANPDFRTWSILFSCLKLSPPHSTIIP